MVVPRKKKKLAISNMDKPSKGSKNKAATHGEIVKVLNSIHELQKQTKAEHAKSMNMQKKEHHSPKHITHFNELYTKMMLPRLKLTAKLIGGVTMMPSENASGGAEKQVMSAEAVKFLDAAKALLNRPDLHHVSLSFRPNLIWMLSNYTKFEKRIHFFEKLRLKPKFAPWIERIDRMIVRLMDDKELMKNTLSLLVYADYADAYTKTKDDSYNDAVEQYESMLNDSYDMTKTISKEMRAMKPGDKPIPYASDLEPRNVSTASKIDFKSIY